MIKKENYFEISAYSDELTKPVIVEMSVKIKQSFPALPGGFYDVFSDRIIANNFTDKRLKDAVTHVIDNCIYPTPTIAQFIAFDKNIKLYNYDQMLKFKDELGFTGYQQPGRRSFNDYYKAIRINQNIKPVWAHVNDIKEFNLTLWNNG